MPPHTSHPPFAPGAQGQPAVQAGPGRRSRRRKSLPKVTHSLAARHEALWLRLSALQAQVLAVATRRPGAPVAGHTATVAEALLREAAPFLSLGEPLPMAAPDHGGLCTQLGQALAGLEAWQAVNSAWRSDLKAYVWLVAGDTPLPVMRLRPKLDTPAAPHADPQYAAYLARVAELRDKLAQRIAQFRNR